MRIVVLIGGTDAPLTYFANTINRHHKIELLVIENPKAEGNRAVVAGKKRDVSFSEKIINYLKFRLDTKRQNKKMLERQSRLNTFHAEIFNGQHKKISADIPTVIVDNINSKETEAKIAEIKPDLIIDHGTSLVKNNIIELASLSLNLHWGLSPYYRGVMCTNQALLNWDINNIGVTIHKLAKEIDGGDILGQSRVEIKPDDSIGTITSKLTLNGTEIVLKAIDKLKRGEELKFSKQNFNHGFITRAMNWNTNINNYFNELDESILNKMIAKPSRGRLPIIEL